MAKERPRIRGNDIGPSGDTVATNVARVRKSQLLSLAALSDRLKALGRPISVSGLSKVENGERRVDVDDLMALAYALDVSPLGLLLPLGRADELVPVTGAQGAIGLLWQWATAEFSPHLEGTRGIAARSLPDWLVLQSDIEKRPGPTIYRLEFTDPPFSDETSVVQTQIFDDRGVTRHLDG